MRAVFPALVAASAILAASPAEARRGRGIFFLKRGPEPSAQIDRSQARQTLERPQVAQAPGSRTAPRRVGDPTLVLTRGGPTSPAGRTPAGEGGVPQPAAPAGEARAAVIQAETRPAPAPRPWCETGTVVNGFCVIN